MAELARLRIDVAPEDLDVLEGILAMYVPYGWEEGQGEQGRARCIVHSGHQGFCAELAETIRHQMPGAVVLADTVEELNWVEVWKEFFTPVQGGEHFLVLAPWMEQERAETTRIPIIIEPKMAFGTGHHPTTALCLDAISLLFTQGHITPGMSFFDLGTGSGILGLGAAKLGLVGEGVDIDGPSIINALENREINGLTEQQFQLRQGGIELASGAYHLITANILAEPLKFMAPNIVNRLARQDTFGLLPPLPREREQGCLVLSGLLVTQADAVEAEYTRLGLPPAQRLIGGEWAALIFIS